MRTDETPESAIDGAMISKPPPQSSSGSKPLARGDAHARAVASHVAADDHRVTASAGILAYVGFEGIIATGLAARVRLIFTPVDEFPPELADMSPLRVHLYTLLQLSLLGAAKHSTLQRTAP